MTFAAYPINPLPGQDFCANDPQNPPVLVLLSRGFNTGVDSPLDSNPPPIAPLQDTRSVSVPPQFASVAPAPNAQAISTNLPLGTANQITQLGAVGTGLQRMNTPALTSAVL
jgi:hypothetical protein